MPHPQAMRVGHVVDPGEGLVNQLQSELELPAVVRIRNLAEVAGSDVIAKTARVGVTFKLGVVEDVKCLSPELHVEPFSKGKVLEE